MTKSTRVVIKSLAVSAIVVVVLGACHVVAWLLFSATWPRVTTIAEWQTALACTGEQWLLWWLALSPAAFLISIGFTVSYEHTVGVFARDSRP